ncbi:efflux RND transporter periplasmic adaptor subunit [Segatella oulorum]|uniref:efflux RND transporter periplasmic adaptor subunit n=1 Tax=Segatella oulorum TaxID=28136 RepID=UPI0023F4F35C|nr:efflux RND transporter periplasmic adaptor subunit [Segatella oulorum]
MRKKGFYLLILLTMVMVISCGNYKKSDKEENAASEKVETEKGEEEVDADADPAPDLSKTVNVVRVTGTLALDPQNRAEVSPIASGVVRRITTREGIRVRRGQVVAYIENTQIVELQRQYLTAVNELSAAKTELARQHTLMKQEAGVLKTLQQAESAYAIANAQVVGIGRQLSQLGVNPSSISAGKLTTLIPVTSPISGIVGKVKISMGSFVDISTSLMTVVNNVNLHCDLKVFEKDLPKVRIGQMVKLTLTNAPEVTFRAKVYDINSAFDNDSKSVTVHARIIDHPATKLLPDMFINGVIE